MPIKPGLRLRSQVCTTEVVVIRSPAEDIELRCGGEPLVELRTDVAESKSPKSGLDTGNQLGKRYTTDNANATLELLVTKPGDGTLSVGDVPLVPKEAKPLPSSD